LTVKGVLYVDFIGELTQGDWIMDRGEAGCPAALLSTDYENGSFYLYPSVKNAHESAGI